MSDSVILKDLTGNFEDRFKIKNVNWVINPAQHWVITGTNGSGKSALAAVLAGVG
ncbi:ATP-binding cassette domain-containing protein [Marinobacterium litorale]|uniref:ATP-binding cassette domain-containing protein n=1 Tax=Marinobacterium litorale TaxID=404770 RepID=UPI00041E8118|nr:ATP-binding cassette domain-containing protein [Marinobacterium litorale]